MSYITNINRIDSELKTVFNDVLIDNSDFRQLNIKLSKPVDTEINESLEMVIFVSQTNLNNINPILEWGYYTDPNKLDNSIKFRSPSDSLASSINGIIKGNRLNEDYLNSIKKPEKINESSTDEIEDEITHINQTYVLSTGELKINSKKLCNYISTKYGVIVDDVQIEYNDVNTGRLRKYSFTDFNSPTMGDEANVSLLGLSSKSISGNIEPSTWISIENDIRKIPFVEFVNSSTYNYSCFFTFSTKVFVELV